jgi:hypothetical protein
MKENLEDSRPGQKPLPSRVNDALDETARSVTVVARGAPDADAAVQEKTAKQILTLIDESGGSRFNVS